MLDKNFERRVTRPQPQEMDQMEPKMKRVQLFAENEKDPGRIY